MSLKPYRPSVDQGWFPLGLILLLPAGPATMPSATTKRSPMRTAVFFSSRHRDGPTITNGLAVRDGYKDASEPDPLRCVVPARSLYAW